MTEGYNFTAEKARGNWGICEASSEEVAQIFQRKHEDLLNNGFPGFAGNLRGDWESGTKTLRDISTSSWHGVRIPPQIIAESTVFIAGNQSSMSAVEGAAEV